MSLDITHDIASQIDRRQILDWGVVEATFAGCAIVCGDANALEGSLIHTIDVDALVTIST